MPDDATIIEIPKQVVHNKATCIPGHYYEIKLADYLVHPPADYNLHINWNRGIVPKSSYYRCEILQVMGKMVQINGVSFDPEGAESCIDSWVGWLPLDAVDILTEM